MSAAMESNSGNVACIAGQPRQLTSNSSTHEIESFFGIFGDEALQIYFLQIYLLINRTPNKLIKKMKQQPGAITFISLADLQNKNNLPNTPER